jgi:hypothetical protein
VVKPRRRDRDDDHGSAAPLYFDFEDEDEGGGEHEDGDGEAGEPRDLRRSRASRDQREQFAAANDSQNQNVDGNGNGTSDANRIANEEPDEGDVGVLERAPRSVLWWSDLSRRRQRTVLGAVVLTTAVALAVAGTVRQADQRARDRIAMSALAGNYVPSPDGEGLDLAITLRDDGPAIATLIWVGVNQPGLALGYPPLPLPIKVGHTMAIKLGGRYTCNGETGAQAKTLTVLVQSPRGVISDITLPMPSDAVLPTGWQGDRAAFCNGMALVPQGPIT